MSPECINRVFELMLELKLFVLVQTVAFLIQIYKDLFLQIDRELRAATIYRGHFTGKT